MRKIKSIASIVFAKTKDAGYKYIVYERSPLVRFVDFMFESECAYCMATRAMVFGLGVGIGGVVGLLLAACAIGMTFFERFSKGD